MYLLLHWAFIADCKLSLEAVSRGCSLVAEHGLFISGAFLAEENVLQGMQVQQLWLAGTRAQSRQLWHVGVVAPQHGESWGTRDQTCVPCISRWILNDCTTREVLLAFIFEECFYLTQNPTLIICSFNTLKLPFNCLLNVIVFDEKLVTICIFVPLCVLSYFFLYNLSFLTEIPWLFYNNTMFSLKSLNIFINPAQECSSANWIIQIVSELVSIDLFFLDYESHFFCFFACLKFFIVY